MKSTVAGCSCPTALCRPSASQERLTTAAMTSCARSQPSPFSLAALTSLARDPLSAQCARLALSAACPVPCDLPSIDFARPVPRFPRPPFPALSAPAHTHPLTASIHYRPTSVPPACSESRRPARAHTLRNRRMPLDYTVGKSTKPPRGSFACHCALCTSAVRLPLSVVPPALYSHLPTPACMLCCR